jgi:hypothetical protein
MSKKVLILVLSCETRPYGKMVDTSKATWDSHNIEGCETLYYFGISAFPRNSKDCVCLPVSESLENMGEKTIQGLEYALNNYEFDYIARVHSSCYVNKKKLIQYVQTLPDQNIFEGLTVKRDTFDFVWGGGHYIISRDVVKQIVDNKTEWNHKYMEDESMSLVVKNLGIPFKDGNSCSINKTETGWSLLSYGFGKSFNFEDFKDVSNSPHYFYRVKQDQRRELDEYIMIKLHGLNA